jgi:hypothetical protein
MHYKRIIPGFFLLFFLLYSCNKELNINADWQDITIVYGLLSQNEDTTFIKITKAFLGPGDALQFAKIADSSNYKDTLDVRLEAWNGSNLVTTYGRFDTLTKHTKEKGDSIFYYPDQLVYFYRTGHLDENLTYKLKITNHKTGKLITSSTSLVHHFSVEKPDPYQKLVTYLPGQLFEVKWDPAYGGKRYQLIIRFYYNDNYVSAPPRERSLDWLVFNNVQVTDPYNTAPEPIVRTFPGDVFYTVVGAKVPVDPTVISRTARRVDYIFSVASEDLNTYMVVTEPSLTIIQERPQFTNITNGLGLFSSRYINTIDSISLSNPTLTQLHVNPHTAPLGF